MFADAPKRVRSTEAGVLLACAAQVVTTTVHHVYGAVHFGTPGRYAAVIIALALFAVTALALAVSGRASGPLRTVSWWIFWTGALVGFVLLFGTIEGLVTHVIAPIVEGGYPAAEPFDLVFQGTGVLHVVPAAATAALLTRLLRARRQASPAPA